MNIDPNPYSYDCIERMRKVSNMISTLESYLPDASNLVDLPESELEKLYNECMPKIEKVKFRMSRDSRPNMFPNILDKLAVEIDLIKDKPITKCTANMHAENDNRIPICYQAYYVIDILFMLRPMYPLEYNVVSCTQFELMRNIAKLHSPSALREILEGCRKRYKQTTLVRDFFGILLDYVDSTRTTVNTEVSLTT